ncbi:MAG: DUF11 domain-containing protein [Bacilli bacterium]|nr:DUF11 domain-containing protein [Bacilli bacterium]
MRQSQRDKRDYLIIGLCAVVAIMAVGFAAFSQQLTINSTSEVTSTWCVGFDTSKTTDYVATPGLSGATTPTASMSYSGNTCGSDNLQTGASLSASFKQPGDQVVYTFTIKNASSLNAKLDSITENLTTSNSAIEYTLSGAKANDILGPNDTTTLVVTVRYKNSVTSQPEVTTWELELKLNFSQTNDSPSGGGSSGLADGTYYSYNFEKVYLNTNSIYIADPNSYYTDSGDGWYETLEECNNNSENPQSCFLKAEYAEYLTLEECEELAADSSTCTSYTISLADRIGTETNYANLNKNVFNKYVVSDGVITAAYACQKFSFINEPVCLQGGGYDETTGSSPYYTANRGIIEGLANTFTSNGGSCSAADSNGYCYVGDLGVYAYSSGYADAHDNSTYENCDVSNYGDAYCY